MKKTFFVLFLLISPGSSFAQTTQVTGQVLDANGIPYAGAMMKAGLVFAGTPVSNPTITISSLSQCQANGFGSAPCQVPFAPTNGPFSLDVTGNIPGGGITLQDNSLVTPAGTQWVFSVNTPGLPPPVGTGPQTCSTTLTITGGSQSISTSFASCPRLSNSGSSALAGGTNLQGQFNNVGVLGGTNCWGLGTLSGPLNVNCDFHTVGPNPYFDVTLFGNIRDVDPTVPPQTSGVNATCTNGLNTLILSIASTFQNRDGIVARNCGAAHSMVTPVISLVQPSVSRVLTGVGDEVPSATGATTYNYEVVACDLLGGCTAPSAPVSTNVGQATLGSNSITLTTLTRANQQVTAVTSTPHALPVGCTNFCPFVYILSSSDKSFNGYWHVDSVADSTHFTFTGGADTKNGATTTSTGGTVIYYLENQIIYSSAGPSAFQYYLYSDRGSPGTFTLVGHSWPVNPFNSAFTENRLQIDDYGSPMNDNFTCAPWYLPTTAPVAATHDNLITTIQNGAGTTTLTVAAPAGNSTTDTIRFDDSLNLKSAVVFGGTTYIPNGVRVVLNSALNLGSVNPSFAGGAGMTINDSMIFGSAGNWSGVTYPVTGGAAAFSFKSNPQVQCNVTPCIFFTRFTGNYISDLQLNGRGNQQTLLFTSGTGGGSLGTDKDIFVGGGGGVDSLQVGFIQEGGGGHHTQLVVGGQQQPLGTNSTPAYYCSQCGENEFNDFFETGRGALLRVGVSGSSVLMKWGYAQGGLLPFMTVTGYPSAGNLSFGVDLEEIFMDTIPQPVLAYLPSRGTLSVGAVFTAVAAPSSGLSYTTGGSLASLNFQTLGQNTFTAGLLIGNSLDGVYAVGNTSPKSYPEFRSNGALLTGASYPIFVNGPTPAQPTCVVNAGGSLSIGTHTYILVPVWQNNSEGVASPASAGCTTSSGNQSITVSWTTVPGNPAGYNLYRDGGLLNLNGCFNAAILPTATSFVDSGAALNCGTVPSTVAAGGPTMLMPGVQGFKTPKLILGPASNTGLTQLLLDDCGVTTTCAQTQQANFLTIKGGPIALVGGTITITALPFTSSTTYVCTPEDSTAAAAVQVVYVSGGSVTFNGTGTDTIRFSCVGN